MKLIFYFRPKFCFENQAVYQLNYTSIKKTIENSLLNAETLNELVCIATPRYYLYCFRLSKTPNSSL